MKLGVLTLLFGERPLEETLDYLKTLGVQAVEFGTGGYVKAAHSRAEDLLNDESKVDWLKKAVADRDLIISAVSCHGNPLHPDPTVAQAHHEDFVNSCKLAQKLDVKFVNGLSGCPGSDPTAKFPNWITCPIPPEDFRERWGVAVERESDPLLERRRWDSRHVRCTSGYRDGAQQRCLQRGDATEIAGCCRRDHWGESGPQSPFLGRERTSAL